MAKQLNPRQLEAALLLYKKRLGEEKVGFVHPDIAYLRDLPLDQVEAEIKSAAQRAGQFESYSGKLISASKEALKEKRQDFQAGLVEFRDQFGLEIKYPDPFASLSNDGDSLVNLEKALAAESARYKVLRREYEPIPADSDPVGAVRAGVRAMLEAGALASMMKAKGWGFDRAVGSSEFERIQKEIEAGLDEDQKALANNPFFQRFKKDYPVVGDALMLGFTGGAGAVAIGAREILVHALVAADDPTVRSHIKNIVTGHGDAEEEASAAFNAAAKRIEKAYFSQEMTQRRMPLDILLSGALTSPAFLKTAGLPVQLPENLVMRAVNGVKQGAMNLRETTQSAVVRGAIDFFRNKDIVRGEKFLDRVTARLANTLGGEAGAEVAQQVRDTVAAQSDEIATSMAKREEIAKNIFSGTYDTIRAWMTGLTPNQKVATLYKVQNYSVSEKTGAALIPKAVLRYWDDPSVAHAAEQITSTLENVFRADQMAKRSNYWPAYRFMAEDLYPAFRESLQKGGQITREMTGEILSRSAEETFRKARVATDIVHATAKNVDNRIDDLIFRVAAPRINAILAGHSKDAKTLGSLFLQAVDGVLDKPQALKVMSDALADTPIVRQGPATKVIKSFINTAFLTTRPGAWVLNEGLDGIFAAAANVTSRVKQGARADLSAFFGKAPLPADLTDTHFVSEFAKESWDVWRPLTWLNAFNNAAFRANSMIDGLRNKAFFNFNFQNELAEAGIKAGVAAEKLGEPAVALATQRAMDATKKFALAFANHSAFTTHWTSAILWPYMGFWQKAVGRAGQLLGETPELFKAGGYALHQIQEMNREYPQDYEKESISIFNHRTNLPRKLVNYPIFKWISDSNFGAPKDTSMEGALQRKAEEVRAINDPVTRLQVIERDENLRDYLLGRPIKAVASLLQAVDEMQVLPIGPGITIPAKLTGLLNRTTPHLIPGGRPLTQLAQGVGLDFGPKEWIEPVRNYFQSMGLTDSQGRYFDIEGFLIPSVRAWNESRFDADVQTEMLLMEKRGEKGSFIEKGGLAAFEKEARDRVRTRTLSDLFMGRMMAVGRGVSPEQQELNNQLQKLRGRADLFVPTDKEVADITAKTGITNLDLVDLVWRESYLRTFQFDKDVSDARLDILKEFPHLRVAENIVRSRREKSAIEEVKDRLDAISSLPLAHRGAALASDRLTQAFIRSYNGKLNFDEDGNAAFEITFDGDDNVGQRIFGMMMMTPEQRLEHFQKGTPDNELMRVVWPNEYQKLRLQSPQFPSEIPQEGKPVLRTDAGKNLLRLLPQPIEAVARAAQTEGFWSAVKDLAPETPLNFPQNAFTAYATRNVEKVKAYGQKAAEAFTRAGEFLMRPIVGDVEAASYYGSSNEQIQTAREILNADGTGKDTPVKRQMRRSYFERIAPLEKFNLTSEEGMNKALSYFQAEIVPHEDLMTLLKADPVRHHLFDMLYGYSAASRGQGGYSSDLRRLAVGATINADYWAWFGDMTGTLSETSGGAEAFKNIKRVGEAKGQEGKSYWDTLRFHMPALVDEVDMRIKGAKYQLGFYSIPRFEKGEESLKTEHFNLAYSKPGETRLEWDTRVRQEVKTLPEVSFARYARFLSEKGKFEVVDSLRKIRADQYAILPLDRASKQQIDAAKDFILTNGDDVPMLAQYVRRNPELTELMRNYDVRTYKTLENKLFSDTDESFRKYLQASGYAPEAMDYYKRHAPNSFSRVFWKDPSFRATAESYGMAAPDPTGETAVTRPHFNPATGQTSTIRVASVLASPEPLAPEPIPEGVFSNPTNMLLSAQRRARRQASSLIYARSQGQQLSDQELEFINAPPSQQVFMSIPGFIGQGFREGKLGPSEVIGQFKTVADYGLTVGALPQDNYDKFVSFLSTTSNVLGATNFGFRLGQFLDDTFNTPRIPINNRFVDFVLAGGPVSQGAINQPGERLRPIIAPTVNTGLPNNLSLTADIPPGGLAPQGPSESFQRSQDRNQNIASGAGAASAASVGIPPLAAAFAIISAGFSIYNSISSGRQRKKMKAQAAAAAADQARRIEEARLAAIATSAEGSNRQAAEENFRLIQQEQRDSERDFQERTRRFLSEGATFASLASQPKEFQQRFVDRFEPEVIQFAQRPQFQSRLNLIQSIQGRLPQARF